MSSKKPYHDFEIEDQKIVHNVYCAYNNEGDCIGEADTFRDIFRLYGAENVRYVSNCDDVYINHEYVETINKRIVYVKGD